MAVASGAAVLVMTVPAGAATAGISGPAQPHGASAQADGGFGQNGVATLPYANGGTASALAIQPDGRILVGGTSDSGSASTTSASGPAAVSRLQSSGAPDTSFGTNGVATLPIAGQTAAVAVAPDGTILALCDAVSSTTSGGTTTTSEQVYVVRLSPTGALVSSFGSGGEIRLGAQSLTQAGGLAVLSNGSIFVGVAQASSSSTSPTGAVYRLLASGAADTSFGTSGSVAVDFGVVAVAAESDGGVVAGGASLSASGIPTGQVERLSPTGTPQSGFGSSGVVQVAPGAPAVVTGVAIDSSGRIDLTANPITEENDLGRLTANGAVDSSFGRSGFVSLSDPRLDLTISGSLAVSSAGVVVGAVNDLGLVTARFRDNGQPDVGFGTDGVATVAWPEGGPPFAPGDLALQSDGSVVTSGTGPGGSANAVSEAGYVTRFKSGDSGSNTQANQVGRVAGSDRIGTAVKASQALFPTAPTGGDTSASGVSSSGESYAGGVVLASALSYPDALVGVPLAAFLKGPLLLTDGSSLESEVSAEIDRVLGGGSSGGTVDVLGGTAVISNQIVGQLTSAGYQVHRYGGTDRYGTAVAVASQALGDPPVVLEATGTDFADAASAGAAAAHEGAAVLLTAGSSMPSETQQYLSAHTGDIRFAVGAPAATADPAASSVEGSDRYATSAAVAGRFFITPDTVAAATGLNYPDALAGGVYVALMGGPLLLSDPNQLPPSTSAYLTSLAPWIATGTVIGGTAAVSESVRQAIAKAIT